jgi:hypothetical protein
MATWYVVYRESDGEAVSIGTVLADPLPEGMAAKAFGSERPEGRWNPATLDFDPLPAPEVVMSRIDFMRRFTPAERVSIRASTDPYVRDIEELLRAADTVSLSHPDTQQGIGYLMHIGLLSPERGAEILA